MLGIIFQMESYIYVRIFSNGKYSSITVNGEGMGFFYFAKFYWLVKMYITVLGIMQKYKD